MKEKVLISGILGQDGSLLGETFDSRKYELFGIIKKSIDHYGNNHNFIELNKKKKNLKFIECDVRDFSSIKYLIKDIKPNQIFHLAANHSDSSKKNYSKKIKKTMFETNYLSTKSIIESILSYNQNCFLLFAASSQMYSLNEKPISERTITNPSTYYGVTKEKSWKEILYAKKNYGLRSSTVILFNHESERRKPEFLSKKITQTIAKIKLNLIDELGINNINHSADWCSARDVIKIMRKIVDTRTNEDFVIGSGKKITVKEILNYGFNCVNLDWEKYVLCNNFSKNKPLIANNKKIKKYFSDCNFVNFFDVIRKMIKYDIIEIKKQNK